jgi:hypothetical protein
VVYTRLKRLSDSKNLANIRLFFLYICQHLVLWAFGRTLFALSAFFPSIAALGRTSDILIIILQLSNIFMYYGISKSIQQSLSSEMHWKDSTDPDSSLFEKSLSEVDEYDI